MDTNSLFSFMDIMILGCGGYLLYAWILLMFKGEIRKGVLLPDGADVQCHDLDGYRKFIGWKLLVFALSGIVCGILGLYSDYVAPVNSYLYLTLTVLFFLVLIWFTTQAKKAEKIYFS